MTTKIELSVYEATADEAKREFATAVGSMGFVPQNQDAVYRWGQMKEALWAVYGVTEAQLLDAWHQNVANGTAAPVATSVD